MNYFQTFYRHSSTHFAFYLFDNAFVEVFSMFLFQIHNFQNILQTSPGPKEDERKVFAAL